MSIAGSSVPLVTPNDLLAVFNEATGPLGAEDICEALDHNLLPTDSKNAEDHDFLRSACQRFLRNRRERSKS